jgi:hypothetical protein
LFGLQLAWRQKNSMGWLKRFLSIFVWLRKAITILFLSIYLLSATEISQLLKLPKLIEHVKAHQLSLWEFLCIHYGQGNVFDADYNEDMKLPFKAENNTVALTSSAYYPLLSTVSISVPAEFPVKNSFAVTEQFVHSSYLSNIWQPPKIS